ncbi:MULTISPECIES: 2,4-dienoyl-CoA reductase [Anoxybacillus]|jgi:NAD(P)-dependent dehydrogenase (short-subunit alcohol dehydrogenase family)|uniref:2,4-dienoyl-CoA reductase n=1 Tax=Anoxybacillus flavithermus TaxID=33934 RepID=A0A178TJD2_9BACL|nr:2,4-dienoyl-CoA reductase [Anoxybacillus flavithermus]ASA96373.1 2,4-dienoyl-CoA reductase [Anoxybacillus flavithermus]ELK21468.1 short chain dehydrogenase [Anoxybacillus flavithermus TNO-09.006]MBE2903909.1 2,4-dienoyl-CoA reductase [Anoxybacillus flavithermus]MBE2906741.1 2,4-dienoyl-CoA reductase [Anoxybacillus flavithermus]MBE2909321.1 2,4-dienoyl-CoA reductase [Anoxybacillus flavithermus]
MNGKVIIVTGGSSGMGKYMAKRFADEGAHVVITGRRKEALDEAANEIGGSVLPIVMDVRKPELVAAMVKETDERFGKIDALINNAAGNFICPAEKLSINGWNSVIDIVLNGTFYCSREVGNYWIEKGKKGSIINIVATYAWGAGAGVIHSACAKAGVLTMTRTLAVEWGKKYGFRVNAIAPGPIERTGGAEKLILSEEMEKRVKDSVPLGRFGTPEEIAGVASFLLSDAAAYINGECITVDGGQWLNQHPF